MKIASIIVSYNPDEENFTKVVNSLIDQLDFVLIIDNGSQNLAFIQSFSRFSNLKVLALNKNFGIAKATNEGFNEIIDKNYDFCLLSDQDTIYPMDYIDIFRNYVCNNSIKDVAVFAPVFYDILSSEFKPVYVVKNHRVKKISVPKCPSYVFQAIASGLIIDLKKIQEIGEMNEDLFIDYVDFEWCWRVNKAGFKILCLPQLKIQHHLGDGSVSVGKKKISEHSSIRYYYITRNTFYLSLYTPYLGHLMKLQLFIKAVLYPLGYSILCKPRLRNAKYTLKGMFDGIFKRLGKLC
ncbi:MAG: glycosyltransferase family 2 protein [Treponema sp.]|nr:glycosyltransferase family 2 protein [Treponema sp.]